jgi:hypothetical protein
MWWQDFLWALAAAAVLGVAVWLMKTPERRRTRKIVDATRHQLARTHGYTLLLVSEAGEEIGVQRGGRFNPGFYRQPGSTFAYGSVTYEVVSVEDGYPAATGTLVLRRSAE